MINDRKILYYGERYVSDVDDGEGWVGGGWVGGLCVSQGSYRSSVSLGLNDGSRVTRVYPGHRGPSYLSKSLRDVEVKEPRRT